jgi:hypothetical protein
MIKLINTREINNQGLLFTSHGFDYYEIGFFHVICINESGIIPKVTKNNYAMLQKNVKKKNRINMEQ